MKLHEARKIDRDALELYLKEFRLRCNRSIVDSVEGHIGYLNQAEVERDTEQCKTHV